MFQPSLPRAIAGAAVLCLAVLSGGCDRASAPFGERAPTAPVAAVEQLVDDLRRNDLAAYARHAVPAPLHAQLATAWDEGRTVWPLTELPLDRQLGDFITALAAPGSERRLLAAYRTQFAGAHGELRTAATTLGLFATQYVNREGEYSSAERDHYTQLIRALSQWGQRAPLGDAAHARKAVPRLALAARATGLAGEGGLRRAGMVRSLQRLGPFFGQLRGVLRDYGLDFDTVLVHARITLAEQTGDRARVRIQYTLAGQPVDAYLLLERHQGRWYLSDLLRRARAEAAATPA
ncbi:hypothetical protein [Agrilutibacter solisilvae]|uniref:DUF3828 domain-containing protein n=1 Tax=Agrilutibacter solisilvae TaxID=2763317 RepID=A0A974Y615_9GAMM|nr:hypothetical protein [Lysobacter solisilvae]QSX79246.1 hypothetical protein I8J32_005010 [Lysobacter solisilvae]